jgi:hypothetical protein
MKRKLNMKRKYKHKVFFRKITFYNRWKQEFPPDNWTIIGIGSWRTCSNYVQFKICLFGFEIRILKENLLNN